MPPIVTPRNFLIFTSGLGIYATSVYATYHVYRVYKLPSPPSTIQQPRFQSTHPGVFDALAAEYDAKIGWDETLMRLGARRRDLIALARGDVLEVSAGTGRNLDRYVANPAVSCLTLSDVSEPMLTGAYERYVKMAQVAAKHGAGLPRTEFKIMDVERLVAVPDATYDTVVDTFGLCSCGDPVVALREMARCCKPDGKVLLLEHGRSHYGFLNDALDKTAGEHARAWGCWWNRDIEALVSEAGLEVVEMERYHFGTTLFMVARPKTK
ncbi:Methyltransferase-like protein 7B [Thoreauomyces humboldtii]|nr:Methyltransferase-like protein 7B [Thoreauomyces humboldtii]